MSIAVCALAQLPPSTSKHLTCCHQRVDSAWGLNQRRQRRSVVASTATAVPAGAPRAAADPPSRAYRSLLPPFSERETVLETYADGLWGLVQPFDLGLDIRLRCVVARLPDGSLLLHNPVAPTEEMLQLLRGLGGPVSAVLVTSNSPEHWLYTPAVLEALPGAQLWTARGLFGRLLSKLLWPLGLGKLYDRAKVIGHDPGPLDAILSCTTFVNTFTVESAVLLRPWKALLVSDAAAWLDAAPGRPQPPALLVAGARSAGLWQQLGPPTPQLYEQYAEQGRAFVEAVAAQDFELIIPAHGVAPVDRQLLQLQAASRQAAGERQQAAASMGARDAWRRCFDFLLERQ